VESQAAMNVRGENGDLYLGKCEKKFPRISKSVFLVVQGTNKWPRAGQNNKPGKKLTSRRVREERNRIEFMDIFAFRSF
jgi:hypothetical protein